MWNQFWKCENVIQMETCSPKHLSIEITKLANMQEEMEVFVKNWEVSIPQSVAIATVKAS